MISDLDSLEIHDELIFESHESEEATAYSSGDLWASEAMNAFERLKASVQRVPHLPNDGRLSNLHVLSSEEVVNREIQKFVDKECTIDNLPTFADIQQEISEKVNSINFPSIKLKKFAEENEDLMKPSKVLLPAINILKSAPRPLSDQYGAVVSLQVYKPMYHRESKVLEVEMLSTNTLYDVFKFIHDDQPEIKMFDGPSYAGSGMILIGQTMYITGSEDYSAPYVTWASQYNVPHTVKSMEETKIGSISDLPSLVATGTCCFLFFCGNEIRRIYFSDLSVQPLTDSYPRFTYKRKSRRAVKCCLCLTRSAELVILNDHMLPKNPSYCCNSCYRRLRSGPTGEFILPSQDVIVSPYFNV